MRDSRLMNSSTQSLDAEQIEQLTQRTLGHYQHRADAFWEGTKEHDVSQNIDALLAALPQGGSHRILDFGCGPGRDLLEFERRGHRAVGLDGCEAFVKKARLLGAAEVLHQDFLALDLPHRFFDGVFANASLFHVPRQELGRVLRQLHAGLREGGALFCSNPRGEDQEGWSGERYGSYHSDESWMALVQDAGFLPIDHYYRPANLPRSQQPWLASVWRRP